MGVRLFEVEPQTVKGWEDDESVYLIDVREVTEFEEGHLPGAWLVPTSDFDPAIIPYDPQKKTVFYCRSGRRSAIAALKWAEHWGAPEAYNLKGGIQAWKRNNLPYVVSETV